MMKFATRMAETMKTGPNNESGIFWSKVSILFIYFGYY